MSRLWPALLVMLTSGLGACGLAAQPGRITLDPGEAPPREPGHAGGPVIPPPAGPDGAADLRPRGPVVERREHSTLAQTEPTNLRSALQRLRERQPDPVKRLAALRAASRGGRIFTVGPEGDIPDVQTPPAGSISADPAEAEGIFALAEFSVRGTMQPFIWRGTPTPDFPDCVSIGCEGHWNCSGVLIAPNAVLTARHCCAAGQQCAALSVAFCDPDGQGHAWVGTPPFKAVLGAPIDHPRGPLGGVVVCGEATQNDLRVLILAEDVPNARVVPWASDDEIQQANEVTVVGFGLDENSGQPGHVRERRAAIVKKVKNSCTLAQQRASECFMQWEFVAADPIERRDTCDGDSGGPAYVTVGGVLKLAGITSRPMPRHGSARCGDGGVYTRVIDYAEWLQSIPGIHWSQPPPWKP